MATKLGCLTLDQLQKQVSQSQTQKNLKTSWMWNPSDNNNSSSSNNQPRGEEDDDSWEVRAFAEDTGNIMGTTWPPRSYTCSFCRREFRSAQALGGHMNVHRRDRARLHQTQNGSSKNPISGCAAPIPSSPTFIIPPPEVATNGGLCLFYQLSSSNNPNCNAMFAPSSMYLDSPSTLLSINSYPSSTLLSSLPNYQDTTTMMPSSSPHCYSIKPKATDAIDSSGHDNINDQKMIKRESSSSEDLDLELRLGNGPVAS